MLARGTSTSSLTCPPTPSRHGAAAETQPDRCRLTARVAKRLVSHSAVFDACDARENSGTSHEKGNPPSSTSPLLLESSPASPSHNRERRRQRCGTHAGAALNEAERSSARGKGPRHRQPPSLEREQGTGSTPGLPPQAALRNARRVISA